MSKRKTKQGHNLKRLERINTRNNQLTKFYTPPCGEVFMLDYKLTQDNSSANTGAGKC